MKSKFILSSLFVLFSFVLIQCNSGEKKENEKPGQADLKKRINVMDDSLKVLYKELMNDPTKQIPSLAIYETINRYLEFYKNYPKDVYSATCLDKVQQLYLQEKVYEKSLEYTDTLLVNFPKYEKRAGLLLNAGSTCDMLQDKVNMEKYYKMLLKENPNLNKETRDMVEFRLKHIDLTFDQLIELQMKEISEK